MNAGFFDFEVRHTDSSHLFEKFRNRDFSDASAIREVLYASELKRRQHEEDLQCLESLKSKIKIYEHQIDAASKLINDFGGKGILADEVGLGKTIEAGLIMKEYITRHLVNRILILTPASLVEQWQNQMLDKFNEDFIDVKSERFAGFDGHDRIICFL